MMAQYNLSSISKFSRQWGRINEGELGDGGDPASMNIFYCALYGNVVKSKRRKKNHFIFFFSFLIMKEKNERNHFSCDKLAVARDNGLQDIPVKSIQWDFACMDTDWIFRFCPAIWLLILPLCSRNSALRWHWLPAIVYWAREKENLHTNRTRAYDSCTSVCVSVCVSR